MTYLCRFLYASPATPPHSPFPSLTLHLPASLKRCASYHLPFFSHPPPLPPPGKGGVRRDHMFKNFSGSNIANKQIQSRHPGRGFISSLARALCAIYVCVCGVTCASARSGVLGMFRSLRCLNDTPAVHVDQCVSDLRFAAHCMILGRNAHSAASGAAI